MRQALVLSITTAPCDAHDSACAFDRLPPAEENTTSASRSPVAGSVSIVTGAPRNVTVRPAERDAHGSSSAPRARGAGASLADPARPDAAFRRRVASVR